MRKKNEHGLFSACGIQSETTTGENTSPKVFEKTYFKVDKYLAVIKEVTAKKRKQIEEWEEPWIKHGGRLTLFFDTEAEAVDYKINQINGQIIEAEKKLKNLQTTKKKFLAKFNKQN